MSDQPRPPRKPLFGFKPQDLKALNLGIELVAAIGGFAVIGWWLDQRYGTDPWLLLAGVTLGTVGGCWNTWRQVSQDEQRRRAQRDAQARRQDDTAPKDPPA